MSYIFKYQIGSERNLISHISKLLVNTGLHVGGRGEQAQEAERKAAITVEQTAALPASRMRGGVGMSSLDLVGSRRRQEGSREGIL